MGARVWFTADTSPSILPVDRAILNRAARRLEDAGVKITNAVLTELNMTYKPGMSALDLADLADPRDRRSFHQEV